RPAEGIEATRPGLEYQYVEKEFKTVAELEAYLDSDAPRTTGKVASFDLGSRERDENFGMVFSGLIRIPKDGVYRFEMTCDDGAQLWVGDKLVADGDGLHGPEAFSGTVALSKGLQPLRLVYFNGSGGRFLEAKWALAGRPLAPVEDQSLALAE
ncbi:MAG: hypothetical protein KAU94_06165, partial [Verrucomicrobia bacterium]|nr:hypothetical protein [Verrucomicrobiota bacterium]